MKHLSTIKLAKAIQDKKISAFEACEFYLKRIEKLNPKLNAVITVNSKVLEQAKALDKKGLSGKFLQGVPMLVKDMFCTKNIRTTAGSKMLENFIPSYTASVVQRLEDAGALILGKCNQDEFAMGNSNETSFFGACKNPWNLGLSPGGSSGGSAAAAAASLAPFSLGTDTGGSIRQPSHFCNVCGIKPTYSRASRFGMIAYASSLDQAGPIAKKVEDCAFILHLMCGQDEKDSTTSSKPVPFWHKKLNANIKHLKIGCFEPEGLSGEVQESLLQTKKALKHTKIKNISFPLLKYSASVYYLIAFSEASSNLARYDGIRYGYKTRQQTSSLSEFYKKTRGEGFGEEVKRRILMGVFCLSEGYFEEYFEKAQKVRRQIKEEF